MSAERQTGSEAEMSVVRERRIPPPRGVLNEWCPLLEEKRVRTRSFIREESESRILRGVNFDRVAGGKPEGKEGAATTLIFVVCY